MRILLAVFVAFGCGFLGWNAGLAAFTAVFETLRAYDRDEILYAPGYLWAFRMAGVAIGVGLGAWFGCRMCKTAAGWRAWAAAALAGAGGGVAGNYLGTHIAGLGIAYLGLSKDSYILVSVATALTVLAAVSLLAARSYTGAQTKGALALRGAIVIGASLAVLLAGMNFNRRLAYVYSRAGETPLAWFIIRFPENRTEFPGKDKIGIALLSDGQRTAGSATEWFSDNGRRVLRAYADLTTRTRDRVIMLSVPGEPDRLFRMDFPSNPRRGNDYGAWHRVDMIAEPGGTPRPARPDEDFLIRYMIR